MCGRYVLLKRDVSELMKRLHLEELLKAMNVDSRFNIAPSQPVIVVCKKGAQPSPEVETMRWGWHLPGDAISKPNFVINARGETLRQRPAFRDAFKTRRCVLPASGFYEWQRSGKAPRPHLIQLNDEEPFFMAGLWNPSADSGDKCVVVTTRPNELMSSLHDRMPAILSTESALKWMTAGPEELDTLKPLLEPFPASKMQVRAVSNHVNSAKNEGELCLSSPADPPTESEQLGLGF